MNGNKIIFKKKNLVIIYIDYDNYLTIKRMMPLKRDFRLA